jgi:hypothetical protein
MYCRKDRIESVHSTTVVSLGLGQHPGGMIWLNRLYAGRFIMLVCEVRKYALRKSMVDGVAAVS